MLCALHMYGNEDYATVGVWRVIAQRNLKTLGDRFESSAPDGER